MFEFIIKQFWYDFTNIRWIYSIKWRSPAIFLCSWLSSGLSISVLKYIQYRINQCVNIFLIDSPLSFISKEYNYMQSSIKNSFVIALCLSLTFSLMGFLWGHNYNVNDILRKYLKINNWHLLIFWYFVGYWTNVNRYSSKWQRTASNLI